MLLSGLLLLLICSTQASHFYGTVMTYYPKDTVDGILTVTIRYKLSFHSCTDSDAWTCNGNCGNETVTLQIVDEVRNELWCQREGIMTRQLPSNAPFQLSLAGGNWITSIVNNIVSWKALTEVELRTRSDTGKANTSPQTTILPAVRVPSNCQRDFNLLAFDPDGDEVQCRNGNDTLFECNPCRQPSVLSISPSCTLSFSPTSSSNEGPYAVQLVMEDFPRQTINLTQTNGLLIEKTTNNAISKIPIQFVLKVDPAVPSCTEGEFLPKFVSPTPANRAQLYTLVDQALGITIRAEATNSSITELLFSGPYDVIQNSTGSGEFLLTWTPSNREDGESHPICFVVQANFNGNLYHSELRCVIVTVGNSSTTPSPLTAAPPTTTTIQPTTMENIPGLNITGQPPTTTAAPTITTQPTTAAPTTTAQSTTAALNTTAQPTTAAPTTTTAAPTTNMTTAATALTTVTPGPVYVVALKLRISTTLSLENNTDTILTQFKEELVRRGLPPNISLRLVSSQRLEMTATR